MASARGSVSISTPNAFATQSAVMSPRGGFGPRGRASFSGIASGSVQRAPRSQVVVPGGRLPGPPGANGYKPRRRTPRLAPHSGSSLEHALIERGCECPSTHSLRSQ
jgi:hypothetical protein